MGASNGGLLVGAVEEQRPDLFAVALPGVGVMDMLRFDKFTGGEAWVTEYGTSSKKEDCGEPDQIFAGPEREARRVLSGDSLVTTADHDDRVVPSHFIQIHGGDGGGGVLPSGADPGSKRKARTATGRRTRGSRSWRMAGPRGGRNRDEAVGGRLLLYPRS